MNSRLLEIAQRGPNNQFQPISGSPYALTDQKLVRIGSAPPPHSDVQIQNSTGVEPLHLLLRAMPPWFKLNQPNVSELDQQRIPASLADALLQQAAPLRGAQLNTVQPGRQWQVVNQADTYMLRYEPPWLAVYRHTPEQYELLNVSSQPITLYHPAVSDPAKRQKLLTANDGGEPLQDYDYIEFGNKQYLLTYQTNQWLDLTVTLPQRRLQCGQTVNALFFFQRSPHSQTLAPDAVLTFHSEVRGLDPRYGRWQMVSDPGQLFSGVYGGKVEFQIECLLDCPAPGVVQQLAFVVTLLQNNKPLYTSAKGVAIEFVPCGPFALSFAKPRQVRRVK